MYEAQAFRDVHDLETLTTRSGHVQADPFTTAVALFAAFPVNKAAAEAPKTISIAELVLERHFSEGDYEVDVYVTRGADGSLVSEATISDPASRATITEVDVWTDGATVWWHGVMDGSPVQGAIPAREIEEDPEQPIPICATPITAIVCVGALVVLIASGSCAHTKGICPVDDTPSYPDGGEVPPEDGGGDGDGDDDGSGAGGDAE